METAFGPVQTFNGQRNRERFKWLVLYSWSHGTTACSGELDAGIGKKTYVSDNPTETKEAVLKQITSPDAKYVSRGDVWNSDVITQTKITEYPTEKPEDLLSLIIEAGTELGDIVLDCFAGSGTTLAVAEKLGRRWIGVDCGKLAIYTMQKRLLDITESMDLENPRKKHGRQCKPFTLYNAGLYDFSKLKELS